jgi:hypothetical protein
MYYLQKGSPPVNDIQGLTATPVRIEEDDLSDGSLSEESCGCLYGWDPVDLRQRKEEFQVWGS